MRCVECMMFAPFLNMHFCFGVFVFVCRFLALFLRVSRPSTGALSLAAANRF
jgi:hypothetical protein